MRAGLLREILVFEELQSVTSPSGAVKKEYAKVYTCKGYKKKLSPIRDTNGINAMEEFTGNTLVFQMRYHPVINEKQRVLYQGYYYSISLLDRQISDNTYLVTLLKINT
ncbi:phage head closure protein [Parabacteroides goldsteinii]